MNKFVNVTFDTNNSGKLYAFRNDIEDLAIGDKVVVDTQYGFGIATVKELHEHLSLGTKFIVQKIDTDAHKKRLAKVERLAELKAKMEARRKEVEELEVFRFIAKEDMNMAILLAELEGLL